MSDTVSGPSEAAVWVAAEAHVASWDHLTRVERDAAVEDVMANPVREILAAAHDPANFEDPHDVSVRLGDVVDYLAAARRFAADVLREFGGERPQNAPTNEGDDSKS